MGILKLGFILSNVCEAIYCLLLSGFRVGFKYRIYPVLLQLQRHIRIDRYSVVVCV